MKTYSGKRHGAAADVTVDGRPLNPRLDLWNHSPSGFEWGYRGSGPAQLALAILADHLEDDEEAVRFHHQFMVWPVADLPFQEWTMSENKVHAFSNLIRDQHKGVA